MNRSLAALLGGLGALVGACWGRAPCPDVPDPPISGTYVGSGYHSLEQYGDITAHVRADTVALEFTTPEGDEVQLLYKLTAPADWDSGSAQDTGAR